MLVFVSFCNGAPGAEGGADGVLFEERGGFRYEYHVPTGCEGLYDARRDPRGLTNLLRTRPEIAAQCRVALQTRLGVTSLETLRTRYDANVRRLRALGYL